MRTLMQIDNELGQNKDGYIADIVAVMDNPINDIKVLQNVTFMMKEGVIYKQ